MIRAKKVLALITCTVLTTVTLLTGCGSGNTASVGSKSDGAVQLTWYAIGPEPKDLQAVMDKTNEYLKQKLNVTLDMKFIDYGDYDQKTSVIINSGEPFDIAFTSADAYLNNARKGAFLELTDYLDKQGKDMKAAIDQRFWDGAKIDGKIYAVPNQKEISTAPMWIFTKEYVDKYNIPYKDIHSLEDLEPWLKIIKEKEPDVVPMYIYKRVRAPERFDAPVDPVGVEFDDKTLTVKNMFETDYTKQQIKIIRNYYEKGYINADSATAKEDNSVKRFVTKADGQPYAENAWTQKYGFTVVASNIMKPYVTNASTTGSMLAVAKNSKNPEKAVEILNLLNTDENLRNLIVFGIEGTHYQKIGDSQIKFLDKHKDYIVPAYATGNLFKTYRLEGEPESKWKEFQDFNNNSINSPILGFKFNTENVTTEIAAVNNVIEEFRQALYSGSVDPDEYLAKMNAKLKEQGIDKIKVEMQKQVNEWAKNTGK